MTLARSRAIDALRARRGHPALEDDIIEKRIPTDQTDNPEEKASSAQRVLLVRNALENLSPQQRALVAKHAHTIEELRDALTYQREVIHGVVEVLSAPVQQVGYPRQAKWGVGSQGHVQSNEAKKPRLFYSFGLPKPPAGKGYQVWFMTEKGGSVTAGLFQSDQTGAGVVVAKSSQLPSPQNRPADSPGGLQRCISEELSKVRSPFWLFMMVEDVVTEFICSSWFVGFDFLLAQHRSVDDHLHLSYGLSPLVCLKIEAGLCWCEADIVWSPHVFCGSVILLAVKGL